MEGWAIVGIGINVAVEIGDLPTELQPVAGTLGLTGEAIDVVLEELLGALGARISEPEGVLLECFRERDALLGQSVVWTGGSGIGAGIDGTGRLIVDGDDGIRHLLNAGEVHLGSGRLG